jgi:hypothetical protein
MQASVLLADSAQTDPANKVHALGLGWSVTSTPTPPSAVVVLIKVPWHATNMKHSFDLRLLDGDGQAVMLGKDPMTGEAAPLLAQGDFEVGRPPGLPHGMPIDQAFALNIGSLELRPGQIYEWRLEIDGHHQEEWSAKFYTRPPQGIVPGSSRS